LAVNQYAGMGLKQGGVQKRVELVKELADVKIH
jgi:hypothetical protein